LVGGRESEPTLQEVWEEFGHDPLFRDLDLLGDLRILRRAVLYVTREYPGYAGVKRVLAIKNTFLAFGGRKRGESGEGLFLGK
jgi:hypothetical protein